jgi:Tfp pilus assembly protein PilV
MNLNKKNILGLSLLEALVSTAIIGIGFIAILQMTNYSVQSMQTSSERTKANFMTNLVAEDVIGSRKSSTDAHSNFSNYLLTNEFNADVCSSTIASASANSGKIYGTTEENTHAMKMRKWQALLNNKNYLKCKGQRETRNFRVYKICRFAVSGCLQNTSIQDEELFIGRVQINLNNGKKRKYLYFQSDYKVLGKNTD